MTLPDGANTYTYIYDSYNLSSVQNPDGTYHQYAHGAWPFTNLITKLYDENGTDYASWTYDGTTGKAITSSLAAEVNQTAIAYTTSTVSTVTDALGNTTSYVLTTLNNQVKPTTVYGVAEPGRRRRIIHL
jgi:hypothetical protein